MSAARVSIKRLRVDCVIGVYQGERIRKQPVYASIEFTLAPKDFQRAVLKHVVDYESRAREAAFILEYGNFLLLESAAEALCRWFLLAPAQASVDAAQIIGVAVKLEKPDALRGHAVAEVELERLAEDTHFAQEVKAFGTVDVVFERDTLGLYRLNVAPQAAIPTHVHRVMNETEMVLTKGLLLQNKAVVPGSVVRWPKDLPHRYDNPSDEWQSILCFDSPRFDPDDEVAVEVGSLPEAPVEAGPRSFPLGVDAALIND